MVGVCFAQEGKVPGSGPKVRLLEARGLHGRAFAIDQLGQQDLPELRSIEFRGGRQLRGKFRHIVPRADLHPVPGNWGLAGDEGASRPDRPHHRLDVRELRAEGGRIEPDRWVSLVEDDQAHVIADVAFALDLLGV